MITVAIVLRTLSDKFGPLGHYIGPLQPPLRSYKVFDHLVRRCRDCYFDRREGRLYVECKTHPRHKQAQKMREPKTPWQYKRQIWKHVCW
ncbi:unnamed protein product [Echinostoma caproni]|uniref:Ribosomal protein n=1 Tax=Echinostoma caproni TaxID=27848 RepID=A0A183ANK7_9TREM|nr:unnamed protein product [Echinostoma caproni]